MKLPVVSGTGVIRVLQSFGYRVVRQKRQSCAAAERSGCAEASGDGAVTP